MLVLDLFLSTMSPFGEVVRNAGLLDEIFRVQKRCARVMLDAPFQAKDPAITRITINQICIRRLLLFKKILDGRAPDTRSRLPYRLPRTNCMKRMFFYNAVKLWKNVRDNNLVRSSDVKKFKRNYCDSVMCNSRLTILKLTEIFSFLNYLIF